MPNPESAPGAPPRVCSWDNDPNPAYNFFTTGNVEEIVPGVSTPFTATYFQVSDYRGVSELHERAGVEDIMQAFPPPYANFVSVFAGRFALNLAWANALIATWTTSEGSGLMAQFITTDKADVSSGAYADRERAAQVQRRVYRYLWPQAVAQLDASSRRVEALRAEQLGMDLGAMTDRALWRYIGRLQGVQKHLYASHLGVSGAAGEHASLTGKLLVAALGERFEEAMVAGLTTGLGDVESARPGFELWKLGRFVASRPALAAKVRDMSAHEIDATLKSPPDGDWREFAERFQAFLSDYGYRGQSEADPSTPSWHEDHTFVLSVVKTDAAAPEERDPIRHAEQAQAQREALQRSISAMLPREHRREFNRLAGLAQKYARNRERSKAVWVRSLRLSRPPLLELARRFAERGLIGSADDFWYLTNWEVEDVCLGRGERDYSRLVAARRKEREELQGVMPPEVYQAPPEVTPIAAVDPGARELKGLGVSAGTARGRARVIASVAAAEEAELEPGEILVAPFTDAAWTPLFVPAAAVVVETGGLLSHAATVAREYGIPAVVAVRGATRVIRDGQELMVDGAAGTVSLV